MSTSNKDFKNKKFSNQRGEIRPTSKSSPSKASKSQTSSSSSVSNPLRFIKESWLPYLYYIVFAIFAFIYLYVKNGDYLYACQEHSIWLNSSTFFHDSLRVVGGLSQWVGRYLTQYFYYPWLGSLLLIVLWCLIYILTVKLFNLRGSKSIFALAPCVLLLCSEIYLGYWLYYLKQPGYWFVYSFAILVMLVGLYIGSFVRGSLRPVFIVIYCIALYPLIGFWSLSGVAYIAISDMFTKSRIKYLSLLLAILCIIVVPLIYYNVFTTHIKSDSWTQLFPLFQLDRYVERNKHVPFIVISLLPMLYILFDRLGKTSGKLSSILCFKGKLRVILTVLLFIGYYLSVSYSHFDNDNYHAELRMYRLLGDCDWAGVLEESQKDVIASNSKGEVPKGHTREMILFQNIALLNEGTIGDNMLKYCNITTPPVVVTQRKSAQHLSEDKEKLSESDIADLNGDLERDSLRVNICNTVGPLLYFFYGKCNFAYRWCVENGVEFSFRVDDYKNMIRCAMMSGEDKVAGKYIDILRKTTFHKKWADERLAMLHDRNLYTSSLEYQNVYPLYSSFKNALDGDQGLVEMYLINYFCHMNSDNKKFQEATLAFALINKDISLFWPRFFKYANLHEHEHMPIHYQEAAYLFGTLEHEVDISKMPFDKRLINNRYESFTKMTSRLMQQYSSQYQNDEKGLTRRVGQECYSMFGDTYWWFYYFSRNVHTY